MVSKVAPPILPQAPRQYDARFMDEFIKMVNYALNELRNPGPIRGTTVTLTDLPTASAGLPSGSLWHDTIDNTVKIVP